MKRSLLVLVLLSAFLVAWEPRSIRSTGELTGDALVCSGSGYLYGVTATTDGSNDATVVLYDNTSGTGKLVMQTWEITTSSTRKEASVGFNPPVRFSTGLYVDITCSGTFKYAVFYVKGR